MSTIPKYSKNQHIIDSENKILNTEHNDQDVSYEKPLQDFTSTDEPKKILLDTEFTITVELGKSKIKIKDFLKLSQGDMLVLDRSIKEPLDIFINGYLIAHGEIVVLEKKYGLRIININSSLKNINFQS